MLLPDNSKIFLFICIPASNKLERIKLNIKSNEATRKEIKDRENKLNHIILLI